MERPRIAVAGINPHCGENGLFGTEDDDFIAPAVALARAEGIDAQGPISADTLFYRAYNGAFDLVIAQYHDQGHIPIKLVAFDTAVNVSVGLPIDRCSVDHGTAFDIAGKGIAKNINLDHAIAYARRLASHPRLTWSTWHEPAHHRRVLRRRHPDQRRSVARTCRPSPRIAAGCSTRAATASRCSAPPARRIRFRWRSGGRSSRRRVASGIAPARLLPGTGARQYPRDGGADPPRGRARRRAAW